MGTMTQATLVLLLATVACHKGGTTQPVQEGVGGREQTGLEGTVRRGPTQPACREGESCDEPFQATFTLQQDNRIVARFATDNTGHFVVYAAPGSYVVVPDDPIGLGSKGLEVTVGAEGLTQVNLTVDTGIR
jgi:hypothetical protein